MIRGPPRSPRTESSAASDVYKGQLSALAKVQVEFQIEDSENVSNSKDSYRKQITVLRDGPHKYQIGQKYDVGLNNGFVCRMERLKS